MKRNGAFNALKRIAICMIVLGHLNVALGRGFALTFCNNIRSFVRNAV